MYLYKLHLFALSLLLLCIACDDDPKKSTRSNIDMMLTSSEMQTPQDIVCDLGYMALNNECVIDLTQDRDRDGVPDIVDNCPDDENAGQEDCNLDGKGDLCDTDTHCGGNITGSLIYITNQGEQIPFPYARLAIEGMPSFSTVDEFAQYYLRNLEVGVHKILIYLPIEEESVTWLGERINHPIATYTYELTQDNINTTNILNLVVGYKGSVGGFIQFEGDDKFCPPSHTAGIFIKELPNFKVQSDKSGYFFIENIPEGEYTLQIVSPNFEIVSIPITVVGLVNSFVGNTSLPTLNESNPWTQHIEVHVRATDDQETEREIPLKFLPVFPNLTQQKEVNLVQGVSSEDRSYIYTFEIMHEQHDVYNITLGSADLFASTLYNRFKELDTVHLETIFTKRIAINEYIVLDLDSDQIPNEFDPDIDGDACPNEEDPNPYNYSVYNINLEHSNLFGSLFTDSNIGEWSISATSSIDDLDLETVNLAPYRYPLFHAYGQSALSVVHPLIYTITFPEDSSSDDYVDFSIQGLLHSNPALYNFQAIATQEPCMPLPFSDQITVDESVCSKKQASITSCTPQFWGGSVCEADLRIPVQPGQTVSYRLWIYNEVEATRGDSFATCKQCINQPGSMTLSLYGIMSRQYISTVPTNNQQAAEYFNCEGSSLRVREMNPTPNDYCFPLNLNQDMCRPLNIISENRSPFVITKFSATLDRLGLVNLSIASELSTVGDLLITTLSVADSFAFQYQMSNGHQYHDMKTDFIPARGTYIDCWGF
jgi:hypothetical protein